MSLQSDIEAALEADATLSALLTGGVFSGIEEISQQNAPGAFDANRELKPCALVKLGVETRRGPYDEALSVQTPMMIYLYQRDDYAAIDPAMDRTVQLLHRSKVGTGVWEIEFESAVYHTRDIALDCPLGTLRFIAVRRKL